MRDKLITLIVVIVFGACLFWAAPHINAWAAAEGSNTIECEAGAQVIQLEAGRIRVIGVCSRVPRYEPVRVVDGEMEPATGPVYEYPYPVPGEPYPYIDNPCDKEWYLGEECLP